MDGRRRRDAFEIRTAARAPDAKNASRKLHGTSKFFIFVRERPRFETCRHGKTRTLADGSGYGRRSPGIRGAIVMTVTCFEPIVISKDVFNALDPIHRAAARVFAERGLVRIIDRDETTPEERLC
jgi:hypothetical protein